MASDLEPIDALTQRPLGDDRSPPAKLPPPPRKAGADQQAVGADEQAKRSAKRQSPSACRCWRCCSVDIIQPARVRQSSPLAEYVSRCVEARGRAS